MKFTLGGVPYYVSCVKEYTTMVFSDCCTSYTKVGYQVVVIDLLHREFAHRMVYRGIVSVPVWTIPDYYCVGVLLWYAGSIQEDTLCVGQFLHYSYVISF